jgi:hypothetical protein
VRPSRAHPFACIYPVTLDLHPGRTQTQAVDSIVVRFPGRKWALSAIDDLRAEGCSARLAGCDGEGLWLLEVEGPDCHISVIRDALHVPPTRVCWESFVNAAVAG